MADELAKVLTIPDSVTQKMDDVIEKITEIESASNKMATSVNEAWRKLANGDIDTYLKKLQDVADATQSKKISIDTTDITKAASEAERWAAALTLVATQAANYAATKTANYAIRQEWDEALKAMKAYEEAKYKAMEKGTSVSPEAQASNAAILKRLEELRKAYPELARLKDATWDATKEKLYIQHLERIDKKNQQIEDREARQAHNREIRAKQVEAANTRVLILAEKLSRESGKSQHYAGLLAELQRLHEEYKKLGNSKEDAERRGQLEQEMQQVRDSIQQADGQMRRLSNTTRGLFNYSQQLSRAFALLFSVSQIRGYIRQIREVTAEFELQKVALGSLLQSQEKANELFGQITNLAVRSPFTIKELNTYTKQLAAYNIQYESLFDTTKMLADVSAGLGVDIGRLILAFGQVKAATVLRGTEVRQFTEAGFGILNELATYYTELEGRLVSVGDVQDRITKKMVKFADVEEIFKRVTSAGGMFYNMQEKMAETLYGRWSNLTDRIDLMLNEIGQNNKGFFNLLISLASIFAENWEAVATALQVTLPLFAQFKISAKMASAGMTSFDRTIRIARVGLHSFGKALKTAFGPVSIAIIAIEALIGAIGYLNEKQEAAVKRAEDFNRKMAVIGKASAEYQEIAKTEKSVNETDEQFAKRVYDEKVKSLESFRAELGKVGIEVASLPNTELLTQEQVDQEFALLQERARAWAMFGRQLKQIIGGQATGVEWGGLLGDNLKTDAQELNESYQLLNDSLLLNVVSIKNSLMTLRDVVGETRADEIIGDLTQKPDEDFVEYIKRLQQALDSLWVLGEDGRVRLDSTLGIKGSEGRNLLNNIKTAGSAIRSFLDDIKSLDKEAKKSVGRLVDNFYQGSKDKLKEQADKHPIPFKAQLDTAAAEAGVTDFAKTYFDKRYYFYAGIVIEPPKDPENTEWYKDILPVLEPFGIDEDTLKSYQDLSAYVSFLSTQLTDLETANKKLQDTTADKEGVYAQSMEQRKKNNDDLIEKLLNIGKALGVNLRKQNETNDKDKTRNDYLKESISLIQKMGKEYDEALKYMGEKAATTDISTRYSSLLTDLASKAGMDTGFIADLTFNTEGIIAGLKKIADAAAKAGATEAEETAREAIAKLEGDKVKLTAEIDIDTLENEIDDFFSKYNMGKELSKLGLGKELTSSLFNFEFVDLDDARDYLEKWRKQHLDTNGVLGKNYQEAYNKAQREITEAERKELDERIKMYSKYLKQSVSERIRIEQEAAKKIAEVQSVDKFSQSQKDDIINNIREETQRDLDKLAWDDFKASGMYLDLFENLDQASGQAIDNMLAELDKLRTSLDDLPPEQLKEIINQMDKLQEIKIENAGFGDLVKNIREGVKAARELPKLEKQLQEARNTQKIAEERNDILTKQREAARDAYALAVKTYGKDSEQAKQAKDRLNIAESLLSISDSEVKKGEEQIANLTEQTRLAKFQKKLANSSISEMLSSAASLGRAINNLHGALTDVFGELPTGLEDAFIYVEGLFAGIGDLESGFSDIMSGKFLSGAINTIAGLIRTIGGLFGIGLRDVRRQREIERELELIDELQKKYEKLAETIDNVYSANTYDSAVAMAEETLEAQNRAIERAIAAEEDKKKTDADRIKEWREQYEENLELIKELRENAVETYGGFGTADNVKSAAEDFASAWLEAFNETGEGLDGLSDKMDEWLNNAIQRQLLMRLSDQFITPLLNQFDAMFSETSSGGRIMTKEEIDAWKNLYEQNSREFDEKAKAYLAALNIKPTGTETELSGLQRGIEGVTETTAQALEALLNSVRFYVSDTNGLIRQLYASFMSPDEAMNPMLYELKQHTTLLNAIHSLLNSTTKMTNNNGRALKVLMM